MAKKRNRRLAAEAKAEIAQATKSPPPVYGEVKVFFCEPTGFGFNEENFECLKCGHWTRVIHGERTTFAEWDKGWLRGGERPACEKCGGETRKLSSGFNEIFRRTDTGEEIGGRHSLPVGAVWAVKYGPKGPDGRSLYCMTPKGQWCIDGRANNCTMPDDNVHRCWVRSGKPEDGTLHIGKDGNTCEAGAGSIKIGDYHGFLHHGILRPA